MEQSSVELVARSMLYTELRSRLAPGKEDGFSSTHASLDASGLHHSRPPLSDHLIRGNLSTVAYCRNSSSLDPARPADQRNQLDHPRRSWKIDRSADTPHSARAHLT